MFFFKLEQYRWQLNIFLTYSCEPVEVILLAVKLIVTRVNIKKVDEFNKL